MTPEQKDEWARQNGWLILIPGEAFERRLSLNGSLFLFFDEERRWIVEFNNSWIDKSGKQQGKANIKTEGVKWEKALSEAESYVRWYTKQGGHRKHG